MKTKAKKSKIPPFIFNKPSDKKMNLIRAHSYAYLKDKVKDDEELGGATEHIAGFI